MRTPAGLRAAGKRLWKAVLDRYELDEHELLLLREACRTVDVLDRLTAEVSAADATTVRNLRGDLTAHPALVEARQQRITLTRLVASLRLPNGDEDTGEGRLSRPQHRGGARGAYGTRPLQSVGA